MRDADVRAAVRKELARDHAGDNNTCIVEEMGVWSGSARIDLAVINGELAGYELKSDRDTLERLPSQVEFYNLLFDRVTLVAGGRHARKAFLLIPDWWGRVVAEMTSDGVVLHHERRPTLNPNIDADVLAQMLWKDEAIAVLESLGMAKGWRSKRTRQIHERLARELDVRELAAHVREALKRRYGLSDLSYRPLDVAVDAVLHPLSQTARTHGAGGDGVDLLVSPARANSAAISRAADGIGMADELRTHVHCWHLGRAGLGFAADGSNAPADKKVVRQSILGIDRKAPAHAGRPGVRRDRCVVSEEKLIRQTTSTERLPKRELSARNSVNTCGKTTEVIRNRRSGHDHGTPIGARVKLRERIAQHVAKSARKLNAISEVDDQICVRGRKRIRPVLS